MTRLSELGEDARYGYDSVGVLGDSDINGDWHFSVSVYACEDCGGALVADIREHDKWHQERSEG